MSYEAITKRMPFLPMHQGDAYFSQANPVSGTLYEWAVGGVLLGTQQNVSIITLSATITWGVTQPTPLEIVVTIDGQTIVFAAGNPVSGQIYYGDIARSNVTDQPMYAEANTSYRPFLLEGRSVKVEARVTWAVTQPTPLVFRVKWARW